MADGTDDDAKPRLTLDPSFKRGDPTRPRVVRFTPFMTAAEHEERRHHRIALQVLYEAVMNYRPELVGRRMVDAVMQAEKALGIERLR